MKILYLNADRGIPVLGDKGASVHVREFITALAAAGHEVVLACASLGEGNAPPPASLVHLPCVASDSALAAEAQAAGLSQTVLGERLARRELVRLAYDRGLCAQLRAELDAIGFVPELIYERQALFHAAGASLARELGVPRLLEVNAPLVEEQERFRGLFLKSVAQGAEQRSFRGADAIFAVSQEVAAYIGSTGIAPARIHVVPNGVDLRRFHPAADGRAVRARHGLGSARVLGFIGSFKPWHGVGFLAEAFARLARQRQDVHLLCVGEGPDLEATRAAMAAHGLAARASFVGRIPHAEIPAYLAAMDVSLAPYLPDPGFYFSPLKVVESLACGTPVIAARLGQLAQLVEHGRTGFLFAPGDASDLLAHLQELLADSSRQAAMRQAARARAEQDLGWNRVVEQVTAEGARLVAHRRAA
jgi:glycosyltransferase involved in cell wall biosynthesis